MPGWWENIVTRAKVFCSCFFLNLSRALEVFVTTESRLLTRVNVRTTGILPTDRRVVSSGNLESKVTRLRYHGDPNVSLARIHLVCLPPSIHMLFCGGLLRDTFFPSSNLRS